MSRSQDDSLWGMTGRILRRLDAQERLKKKEASSAAVPLSSKRVWESGFSGGFAVSREITSRYRLALMCHVRRQYAEAERQYQEVLASLGEAVGPNHIEMSGVFNNLGRMYYEQQRYAEQAGDPRRKRSLRARLRTGVRAMTAAAASAEGARPLCRRNAAVSRTGRRGPLGRRIADHSLAVS